MKRWKMLDSVGFMAYRERNASRRTRGNVQVCLMAKCLQRRRRERGFLRLENLFCSLAWRIWALDGVVVNVGEGDAAVIVADGKW